MAAITSIASLQIPKCSFRVSCSSPKTTSFASPVDETLARIKNSGVIACLRAKSGELAMEAARAALNGGISALEITMTTPNVFEVLQELVQHYPTSVIGVGTVLTSLDAKSAINVGAKFLMSPAMVKDILDNVQADEALYIPGVMTPTEVYPVSILGGVQYISSLQKPFSHIPMVASQGVTMDSIYTYIDGGASAVVLSDAIFEKESLDQRNYDAIRELASLAAHHGKEGVQRRRRIDIR